MWNIWNLSNTCYINEVIKSVPCALLLGGLRPQNCKMRIVFILISLVYSIQGQTNDSCCDSLENSHRLLELNTQVLQVKIQHLQNKNRELDVKNAQLESKLQELVKATNQKNKGKSTWIELTV